MTKEKYFELINKAIGNLKDNEDGYGTTPIDFMRKSGVKSTANMTLFLDSVGAYLEEIRCGLLADIEAEEAKKNGKSSVLSAVKRFNKICYDKSINSKPILAYAHYDEAENKYVLCDTYTLLISEESDGMTLKPDSVTGEYINWKRIIPSDLPNTQELPPIRKLSTWLKQKKTTVSKHMKDRISVYLNDDMLGFNAARLELVMKITGATEVRYGKFGQACLMEGNGYTVVLMPSRPRKDEETEKYIYEITDFDNI